MADTRLRAHDIELVAYTSVPAAEYAEYKALREKHPAGALGRLDAAIRASTVVTLGGLPFPVQFRNQGGLDEWRRVFNAHDWSRRLWDDWASVRSTCLDCINELCWQVDQHLARHSGCWRPPGWADSTLGIVARWAANIHLERKNGALIETTPALDALLMQSDIDDALPMQLFSPPFDAQYLQLNRATVEHFRTLEDRAKGRWIEGVFCFASRPGPSDSRNEFITVIELMIVYASNDRGISTRLLRGPLLTPEETVMEWAEGILAPENGHRSADDDVLIKLINNMVKVFLYLGLKDARKELKPEHSIALKRLAGVGPKKQAKLRRRLNALYDRIMVGPASTPGVMPPPGTHGIRAPHWRRGHFRAQPCGPARSSRKLIFVAPVLIHAGRLGDTAPPPKTYELTTGHSRP